MQHRLAGVEVIKCQELLTTLKDIFKLHQKEIFLVILILAI